MGDYSQAAEFYDLIYADQKDYGAEAEQLATVIRSHVPGARTVLDVGCGTGSHARALIDLGFEVDGLDVEPAFVEIATAKCPEGSFHVGDMTEFSLPGRYDAVVCLFSAIGYALEEASLRSALRSFRRHTADDGVVIVDPWFEPGELTHGWISTHMGRSDDRSVVRMSRTLLEGVVSRLEFEYLIGSADGIERRSEEHRLGLFTGAQMEEAFSDAGLSVQRHEKTLRTRGLYVGVLAEG